MVVPFWMPVRTNSRNSQGNGSSGFESASSFDDSSAVRFTAIAPMLSSSCAMVRAPMIVLETPGRSMVQRSATCATLHRFAPASACSSSSST